MVEQPDLLRAVVESPDLDAPRLAYADWCATIDEEDMRARAELIRAQIDLSLTPPDVVRTGGAHHLQRRIADLLARWSAVWSEPLRPYIESASYQRGFAGHVRMTGRGFLEYAERIFALAPVQHVDLTAVRDVRDQLLASPYLGRLKSLSLDGCGLTADDMRAIGSTPALLGLRWLSLRNNNLDLDGSRAIAASPVLKGLRVIQLAGNPVDPSEELGVDGGEVVDTALPESGEILEREFGSLPWLHWTPGVSRYR
jgi:uncharacterized protein (TIGR02996 family)